VSKYTYIGIALILLIRLTFGHSLIGQIVVPALGVILIAYVIVTLLLPHVRGLMYDIFSGTVWRLMIQSRFTPDGGWSARKLLLAVAGFAVIASFLGLGYNFWIVGKSPADLSIWAVALLVFSVCTVALAKDPL
jgi:hypothetical protein